MLQRRSSLLAGVALGGLALVATLPSLAGCGGASNGYSAFANDAGGVTSGNDATTSGSSSGSSNGGSSGDDGSEQCVSGCTSDDQCQNSCPSAPNGSSNCCDVTSGTCMMMNQSSCPGPADSPSE
jgi:hypothetical protein